MNNPFFIKKHDQDELSYKGYKLFNILYFDKYVISNNECFHICMETIPDSMQKKLECITETVIVNTFNEYYKVQETIQDYQQIRLRLLVNLGTDSFYEFNGEEIDISTLLDKSEIHLKNFMFYDIDTKQIIHREIVDRIINNRIFNTITNKDLNDKILSHDKCNTTIEDLHTWYMNNNNKYEVLFYYLFYEGFYNHSRYKIVINYRDKLAALLKHFDDHLKPYLQSLHGVNCLSTFEKLLLIAINEVHLKQTEYEDLYSFIQDFYIYYLMGMCKVTVLTEIMKRTKEYYKKVHWRSKYVLKVFQKDYLNKLAKYAQDNLYLRSFFQYHYNEVTEHDKSITINNEWDLLEVAGGAKEYNKNNFISFFKVLFDYLRSNVKFPLYIIFDICKTYEKLCNEQPQTLFSNTTIKKDNEVFIEYIKSLYMMHPYVETSIGCSLICINNN